MTCHDCDRSPRRPAPPLRPLHGDVERAELLYSLSKIAGAILLVLAALAGVAALLETVRW